MNVNGFGNNGFLWFEGVVEDIMDPKALGRVKVRVIGDHSQNTEEIQTGHLCWATVILPVTSSGMNGIGESPCGLLPGSWVVGYYRDGQSKQQPRIFGTLSGIPSNKPDKKVGFNDPYEIYPLEDHLNEPDTNRLVRGKEGEFPDFEKHDIHSISKKEVQKGNPGCATTWDEPETVREPLYPYNKVWEGIYDPKVNKSKWGHLEEWDSTPEKERYFRWHKTSHNSLEIFPDGKEVHKIYGDNFELDLASKHLRVDGDYKITINGSVDEHISGDKWTHIEGKQITVVEGDIVTVSNKGNIAINSGGSNIRTSGKDIVDSASGNAGRSAGGGIADSAGSSAVYCGGAGAAIGTGGGGKGGSMKISTKEYKFKPYKKVKLSTEKENEGNEEKTGSLITSASGSASSSASVSSGLVVKGGSSHISSSLDVVGSIKCLNLDAASSIRTNAMNASTIQAHSTTSTSLRSLHLSTMGASASHEGFIALIPTGGGSGSPSAPSAPSSASASASASGSASSGSFNEKKVEVEPVKTERQWKEEMKIENSTNSNIITTEGVQPSSSSSPISIGSRSYE